MHCGKCRVVSPEDRLGWSRSSSVLRRVVGLTSALDLHVGLLTSFRPWMPGIPTVSLTRHLGGSWLPQAAAGTSPSLTPPPRALRVCASAAATKPACTRMFLAAFRSRSWVRPHCVQVQDLTSRGFLPELNPHAEHSWLGGNQPLTRTTLRWQRARLLFQPPDQDCPTGVVDRLRQPGPGQAGSPT
jgi:hypothetical protein